MSTKTVTEGGKKFGLGSKGGTFKPKKKFDKGSKRYELHKYAKGSLGMGNLRYLATIFFFFLFTQFQHNNNNKKERL